GGRAEPEKRQLCRGVGRERDADRGECRGPRHDCQTERPECALFHAWMDDDARLRSRTLNGIVSMQICMDWSDLRFVLAVRRAGTLTAAARARGLSQSTVTRRLMALHRSLGARVLERRGPGYVLTPLGERLWPMLAEMEDRALALERAALDLDARPAGVVRITTVDALAVRLLAPSLPRFRARFPDVTLEIDSSSRTLDLGRREADLALRLGKPRQESLGGRKAGRVRPGLDG